MLGNVGLTCDNRRNGARPDGNRNGPLTHLLDYGERQAAMQLTAAMLRTPRVTVDRLGRRREYPSTEFRLRAHVVVLGPDDCWEWQRHCNAKGYGQIQGPAGLMLAHRAAYILDQGSIPDEMAVLHSCDNPPCCNPRHLRAGTRQDNTDDMWERGRQRIPVELRNGRCKLSHADIAAIREAHAGGESCKAIARRLGLHPSYVGRIVRKVRRSS